MRKILIPTDFSENAMNAITYAIDLFKYEISHFFIMHAYQDDIYNDETLNIDWNIDNSKIILSNKDKELPDFDTFFS